MDPQEKILEMLCSFRKVHLSLYHLLWKDNETPEITWIQFLVLRTLRDHPDIRLNELAELIHIGNSTTSGVVDRLVKAGLVARTRSENDRRSITLRATVKGDEIRKRTEDTRMDNLIPLLDISAEDREHLFRIHEQIVEKLQQPKEGERETNYE
ncbi:MarR family transcriptional regulator [Paenibacillus pini]|uniref:MarR family winged helix-turn-helix transcriptional regulator n=1 Tax=Paenibacillus pini TaxID=669461 RepID=UPI00055DC99F|nr:MarR family transcriptional regulator [Paenibacillus pini]